jgi:hypothetical protein
MYTYVLSGGSGQPATPDAKERYQALLDAIAGGTSSVTALKSGAIPTAQTNLFCIPATNPSGQLTVRNYAWQLANKYTVQVEKQLGDGEIFRNLEDHSGPFLVSSVTRLSQAKPNTPILSADLSNTHPGAMQEVVDIYKQQISQAPLKKTDVFNPFKLALLNVILNGNDYVRIEKVAIASMLPGEESQH